MSNPYAKILNNKEKLDELVKNTFDNIDTDKSGKLDQKEMMTVLKELCTQAEVDQPSEDDVKQLLDQFDTNQDGFLSLSEFREFIILLFQELAKCII